MNLIVTNIHKVPQITNGFHHTSNYVYYKLSVYFLNQFSNFLLYNSIQETVSQLFQFTLKKLLCKKQSENGRQIMQWRTKQHLTENL